ncbi:IS3 family transposase [Leptospira santarosai]|uniref:IS3 family transposase n=1 Tax=Leptospira santarosai TaxID=28183 RepID=UPI0002928224|nr:MULTISPECIES: transposase [Leptospira]EKO76801.1 integrase core domain protein [Leptospira sp. Fiocruz LV3954]EMI61481.1 integrase core domain protein [Leptospira sp. Fiocruz LV4135]MDI7166040.1 IS3 family transposase [Leptospira santarosai]MDI7174553.1 IS3 family transposase [Leptospira santarosai]MDI7194147.1 IS3 family transposase [Leptospira santarosai]
MKVEQVYGRKFNTIQEAQFFPFDCIERYYNRKRRHSALDYMSPIEFRIKNSA